jgi:cell division septation protein DedD
VTVLSATMVACSTNPVVDNKGADTSTIRDYGNNTNTTNTTNTNSTNEYTYTGKNTSIDNSYTNETNTADTIEVIDNGNYTDNSAQKGFVVQLTASISEAKTDKIRDTFNAEGYPIIQNSIHRNGQILYRVQVGPYTKKEEARGVLNKMRIRYKRNVYIKSAFINENK